MPPKKRSLGDHFLEDVHEYRVDREHFSIYLGGDPVHRGNEGAEPGVDYSMADRFEANMNILSGIDATRPILIHMATCGGLWEEGMQINAAILSCSNPVTLIAHKHARSMSSLIPLAADKFLIRPPATYMFHRGTYGIESLEEEVQTEDIQRRKFLEMMTRIYINRLREQGKFHQWSETRIRNMLERAMNDNINVHLTADEAVTWGFADGVYTGANESLRALEVNEDRRERLLNVLRKPIKVEFKIS